MQWNFTAVSEEVQGCIVGKNFALIQKHKLYNEEFKRSAYSQKKQEDFRKEIF